jgi:ribosomal protein S12 methylthiotransferase accessory factor
MLKRFRAQLNRKSLRSYHNIPNWEAETFDEDISWELDRLESVGVTRVIIVDLTKPEFGLPVVRVVIPGLEGTDHAPGYAPGKRGQAVLESQV